MNRISMVLGMAALLAPPIAAAQVSEERVWSESYNVSAAAPRLSISNIWGSVRVRTGDDGEIRVTVDERRSAPDQGLMDRSRQLLKVHQMADAAGLSIVVGGRDHWEQRNHCNGCRLDLQFDVVVPRSAIVEVATVLDGNIDVAGVEGDVSASNVNGPISVSGLRSCGDVDNVNGRIDLTFARPPGADCRISTINGDVVLNMPSDSGLDIVLDTFNGGVISEFAADTLVLPQEVHYDRDDGVNRYRIQQSAGLRLAGGGPSFSISSMNGDVRIRKY